MRCLFVITLFHVTVKGGIVPLNSDKLEAEHAGKVPTPEMDAVLAEILGRQWMEEAADELVRKTAARVAEILSDKSGY